MLPRPRRLSRTETLAVAPALRAQGLRGGLLGWDGQLEDDARLVVTLARTAAAHGARVLTRVRATALDGHGATVRDELTGAHGRIEARVVVNATGVWAGGLVDDVRLRPSRGTHLVLRGESVPGLRVGVLAPVPGQSNRFVFALPQPDGLVYVGLTDEPADGPVPDVPTPTEAEIGYLVDVISAVFERPLRRHDVVGAYAGLRPLLDAEGSAADLSRRHAVLTSTSGVVTVVGGKLTTYRTMAEDAVDAAVARAGLPAGPSAPRTCPSSAPPPARSCRVSRRRAGSCAAMAPRRTTSWRAPVRPGCPTPSCSPPWPRACRPRWPSCSGG